MNHKNNSQGGFAIVYGLFILLTATIAGTAILFMTQKDHIASADYASTRSSSMAAMAALKAFEGQCSVDPGLTFAVLKKYIGNHDYKWFFGASADVANIEQKIDLTTSTIGPEYSARIVGFDSVNSLIVIEGIGYDGAGGKKKVIASYELGGLAMVTWPASSMFGVFVGGSMENCNAPTNVTGDVYLSLSGTTTDQHLNSSATTITGNLKTGVSDKYLDLSGNLTVTKNAFIQCRMQLNNVFTVNGKSGFGSPWATKNWNQAFQLKDDAYFVPTTSWNNAGKVNGPGTTKTVKYNSTGVAGNFTNFTKVANSPDMTDAQVATALGMTAGNENPDTVKIPVWETGVVKEVGGGSGITYTVDSVLNWWNAQNSLGKLYKGAWLVVQQTGDVTMATGSGNQFTKKLIWITGNFMLDAAGKWFDCTYSGANASNTFIYVNGSGHLNAWGVPTDKNFRGYIYVNSSSTSYQIYQFGTNTHFYGAICQEKGVYDLNTGPLNLDFSAGSAGQSALAELASMGLVVPPAAIGLPPPGLALYDLKVRPKLVSMQL
jgi:hypothetical protein